MDHFGMSMREGLTFVHSALIGVNLRDKIKLGAAGKIISGFDMARVMALGADWLQCGTRLHVRRGLPPVSAMPHRPLPNRRRHARQASPARHRHFRQVAAGGAFSLRDGDRLGQADRRRPASTIRASFALTTSCAAPGQTASLASPSSTASWSQASS
jgi:hypothetical protein